MAAPWNNGAQETKDFRALACDVVFRVASRIVTPAPILVSQSDLKSASQAEFNQYLSGSLPQ